MATPLVAIVFVIATLCASPAIYADCADSITIDSVRYPVGQQWCGRKLDSTRIAKPADLVQLPQELTYQDYRIYVRREVRDAFKAMAAAARKEGINLTADSGFRSKSFQLRLIKKRLSTGEKLPVILRSVAPPGYSEHHTGRALDLCPSDPGFAKTDTYTWLKANAARFGFIESLPKDNPSPLHWEPWHWYYSGK